MNIEISDKLAEAFAFGLGIGAGLCLTYFVIMGTFIGIVFALERCKKCLTTAPAQTERTSSASSGLEKST